MGKKSRIKKKSRLIDAIAHDVAQDDRRAQRRFTSQFTIVAPHENKNGVANLSVYINRNTEQIFNDNKATTSTFL